MINKNIKLIIFFLISAIIGVIWTIPADKAYFIACDVGQGDAILLTKATTQILIDGGPNEQVIDCLEDNMPFWDRTIELVINTHPEKDHLTGLLAVVSQYQVKQLLINSFWQNSELFARFVAIVRAQKIPVYSPQVHDQVNLNGFSLKILWPEIALGDQAIWQPNTNLVAAKTQAQVLGATIRPNEESIVVLASYQNHKILLTGDIAAATEEKILKEEELPPIDILKVAHHGSKYSTSDNLLATIKPKLAVISVGKNQWGHPTSEVLARLSGVGAKVVRTDQTKVKISLE